MRVRPEIFFRGLQLSRRFTISGGLVPCLFHVLPCKYANLFSLRDRLEQTPVEGRTNERSLTEYQNEYLIWDKFPVILFKFHLFPFREENLRPDHPRWQKNDIKHIHSHTLIHAHSALIEYFSNSEKTHTGNNGRRESTEVATEASRDKTMR